MSKLILISGNSGVGKTYLINNIGLYLDQYTIVQKKTTRSPRTYEDKVQTNELLFNCSLTEINKLDYNYSYRGELYGFNSRAIDIVLSKNMHAVMVIRYIECVKALKKRYAPNVITVYCKSTHTRNQIKERLKIDGLKNGELETRLHEQYESQLENEYENALEVFDCILYNNYDANFLAEVKKCIRKQEL